MVRVASVADWGGQVKERFTNSIWEGFAKQFFGRANCKRIGGGSSQISSRLRFRKDSQMAFWTADGTAKAAAVHREMHSDLWLLPQVECKKSKHTNQL